MNLKNRLLKDWSVNRFLRLGLGLIMIYFAISNSDWMSGILSIVLLGQALYNVGICGASGCSADVSPARARCNKDSSDQITFEEIKK